MNSRRRRGLLFLIVSIVVSGATFLAVTAYVANINAQVGDRVTVYQAKADIAPYVPLSADNLVAIQMPRRWASESAILTLDAVSGRRASFKLNKGTTVTSDMLIPVSSLSSTEREVGINVNSVTGVAGRVSPGDRVDVYAVFGDVPGLPKMAKVLVRNVRVVSVAGEQTVTTDSGSGLAEQKVVPVTLALEASDALAVTYASAFAKEVRMVALPNDVGINRAGERNQYDAAGQATTAIVMTVAVLLIGFIWLYQLPIVKAEDQRSGLQQAADAAALAGAQQVAKDLPSVLLESVRHGGMPACGLGQSAAQQFAHRNAAELISYCYYPSSDRVKVTIRSLAVLESGSREEAEATASVGRRLGACELMGPSPTPSPSPSDGAGGDDPEPTKLKYRCGEFVVPVTDTNGLIELIGSEAKLLASFGLTPGLVS